MHEIRMRNQRDPVMTRTHLRFIVPLALVLSVFTVFIASPIWLIFAIYFMMRRDPVSIERQRDALYLAIILIGVLAGEIVGMLFLQNQPGSVDILRGTGVAILGSLVGSLAASRVDRVYATRPGLRKLITFLCTCLLSSAIGGVCGWLPGERALYSQGFPFGLEDQISIIRVWIGIGAAAGLTIGLLLGSMVFAPESATPPQESPAS
jgi:hypothetical protein